MEANKEGVFDLMNTANPVLSNNAFQRVGYVDRGQAMTMSGTAAKTGLLLLCLLAAGAYVWMQFTKAGNNPDAIGGYMMVGLFGGLILALVTAFKQQWASYTAIPYAVLEGLFLGGISAMFEVQYSGLVMQAVGLTSATLFCLLLAYQSGWIAVTNTFRTGIVAATGGIALFYFVAIALSFFNIQMPFIFGNGAFGILFSFFVVGIAALNLVLDFDFIDQGSRRGLPKYMEWYGAFALMVTLVWLYIEILRLLSKLRSRD